MSALGPVPFIAVPLGVGMFQGFNSAKDVKNWWVLGASNPIDPHHLPTKNQ